MHNGNNTFVILTPGFPASETDTTCLPMQQSFVKALKENYPQLNIIILSFQYPYFKKTYNWFGITVMSFGGRNKRGLQRFILRHTIHTCLNNINRNSPISGLLSFWYGECAHVGKIFGDANNIKHYCWILGQDAKKVNKYPKILRTPANKLIALSDFLQYQFEKNHGIRPQHLIPGGIEPKQFSNVKKRDIDILGVGSLIALKNMIFSSGYLLT